MLSCDPMGCSPSGSPVHAVLQARILDWVAIPFSKGFSWSRKWIQVSSIPGRFFTIWATSEAQTSFWDALNSDRAGKSISFFKSWIPNNFFSLLYHSFRLFKSLRCYPLRFLPQLELQQSLVDRLITVLSLVISWNVRFHHDWIEAFYSLYICILGLTDLRSLYSVSKCL